jgi:hypothetical protein
MDYEKKYKEALSWMQSLYNGLHGATKKDAEHFFPELKESEDEKIRKELIAIYSVGAKANAKTGDIPDKDIVAWLEKQGKQKETLCDKCKKAQPSHSCQDITALGRCALENQGVQKQDPCEHCKMTYSTCYSFPCDEKKAFEQDKTALEAINEEKVDNANKVEPRQEKLTKFEKAVKQVMEEAIECGDTHNLKADAEMLLSLVQKSAWSEEDEERVKNILSVLDVQMCWDGATGKKENPYQKEIDWLKSLRPQNTWKPSDEQIKVLEFFIPYVTECSVVLQKSKDTLSSLLSDLKKLREE